MTKLVCIFDTETTGLPPKDPLNKKYFVRSRDFEQYSGARVVQIAWTCIPSYGGKISKKANFIIKPDNYIIPEESTRIHNISHEYAMTVGVHFNTVADELCKVLDVCDVLVAHNIRFDMSVVLAECYRYKRYDLIDKIYKIERFDTMWEGRKDLKLGKIPKLSELYSHLHDNSPCFQKHDALDDAIITTKCYTKLIQKRRRAQFVAMNYLRPKHVIKKPTRFTVASF